MKSTLPLIVAFSACVSLSDAQTFSGGTEVSSGKGSDQKSKVYVMQGPYVLRWDLRDIKPSRSECDYVDIWKPHAQTDPPWVSIRVRDAVTHALVTNEMVTAWSGSKQVNTGGKHYLVVTAESNVGWTIWAKEGKLVLGDGREKVEELKPEETTDGASGTPAAAVIAELKKTLKGAELEERITAVKLVESRSSSGADFTKRWEQYKELQGW